MAECEPWGGGGGGVNAGKGITLGSLAPDN
jgi:hypothetical protein